jgi:hypothetical protein
MLETQVPFLLMLNLSSTAFSSSLISEGCSVWSIYIYTPEKNEKRIDTSTFIPLVRKKVIFIFSFIKDEEM